ncbi:MAG: redoxin domain-containing protein [Gammaproteobacteria bacterium]|nr:redoxin domain-containing protein [Gammaproteobacteria bacterium]
MRKGQTVRPRRLTTIQAQALEIPDAKNILHLQFRRFAGCPFCSVHLRSFARRHAEINAAGICEAVIFRSTATALLRHHGDVPFAVIADPKNELYTEFGVGSGLRALLHPRALLMALPHLIGGLPKLPGIPPWGKGALGFPADFLIATDGRVMACKYGTHADDHWSVDELLRIARDYKRP